MMAARRANPATAPRAGTTGAGARAQPPESRAPRELVLPQGIGPAFARAFASADRAVFGLGTEVERSGYMQYDGDPVRFCTEVLGHRQWAFQKALLRALVQHRFVVVSGPRSSSKTHTVAEAVLAFMCTGPTTCYTTSGSRQQVQMGLWQKIRAMHASSRLPLPGEPSGYKWEIAPEWFAYGFSTNDAGTVQGIHSGRELTQDSEDPEAQLGEALAGVKHHVRRSSRVRRKHRLLLVLDEAAMIRPEILERLEGSMLAPNVYVIVPHNPTYDLDSDHPAARWMRRGTAERPNRFHRIHVASEPFDAKRWEPDPADECFHEVPEDIQPATDRAAFKRGRTIEDPEVRCFVYGLPATSESEFQIVPRRLLVACQALQLALPDEVGGRHVGVDIARQGSDSSVAVLWHGPRVSAQHEWRHADLMATTGVVLELMVAWGLKDRPIPAMNVHLDATGIGAGVVDRLRQMGHYVDGVDFGAKPRYSRRGLTGSHRFLNLKTELHWTMRRGLEEQQLCVPEKYALVRQQLQWPTYGFETRGKETVFFMGESKDELRERYGRSPDHADAAVIGLARGGAGSGSVGVLNLGGRVDRETILARMRAARRL